MTRFIHDQFAKGYLLEILSLKGEVKTSLDIIGEKQEADVYFVPFSQPQPNATPLGLLEKITTTTCVFEPFRNAVTPTEIRSCIEKICVLCAKVKKKADRENRSLAEGELPVLWILTPTFSPNIISKLNAVSVAKDYVRGVYSLGEILQTKIIAIHQLPKIPETIWLRMLGKGRVQQQAIGEFRQLSLDDELKANVLELIYDLFVRLEANRELEREDRELIMELSPLYQQRLEAATQRGLQRGINQGVQQGLQRGKRLLIENFLRFRFGQLDEELSAIIEPLLEIPPEEIPPLLMEYSREELIDRLRK
ncbi:MAG: hypothetical protein F6K35_17720 [Okeania sp. SIO2H7]|nr:hypothetical protein [Okeania sp. SIO2H7]